VTGFQLEREQHTVLTVAAVVAAIVVLYLIIPVGAGILLGAFLAFMAQPTFEKLCARMGARAAAAVTVLGAALGLAALFGALGWILVVRGTALAGRVADETKSGGVVDNALQTIGRWVSHLGVSHEELVSHVRRYAESAAEHTLGAATAVASATGGVLLGLFFAILAMHYVLRNWQKVSDQAQQTLPMRPEYTADLFAEFRRVGRTTLVGAVGTAIAQGVFATIGYWISGVTEPAFFGAATAVASFIPVVGVLTVIVPVAITLFALGMPGHAAIEIAWSLVTVVGLCDYVIRPRLTRGETEAPALVTFIALFGGVEVFGLKGLIVGPVLMAVALAVLRLYAKEARALRGGA
jgi:predicted PurR-regulated permease PerM